MTPQDIAVLLSLLSIVLTMVNWVRGSRALDRLEAVETIADRASRRAKIAEARTNAAEQRAEQAHTLLKKLQATESERRAAEEDAPTIADRWYSASRTVAAKPSTRAKGDTFPVTFRLESLADLLAVELLRTYVGRGDIQRIRQRSDRVLVYVRRPK